MGDFWLKADNGWLGTDKGPQFIDNGDGTATISYLVNTQAPRFTFVKDGSETTENKWDDTHSTSGFKNDFGSKKYKFNKIASGVKKVTLTYTEATDKLAGVYGAYDVDYTGWKLYVDGGSALDMDNSGQRVVSLASGNHTFYITDGSATTFYGVNKFGGMYLSTSYTNQGVTITFPSQRYYDTDDTYKFNINGENIPTYPINGQYDLSAKFTINKAANVTFSFDGGVISLAAVEPVAPHTVTIHPNGGTAVDPLSVGDGQTISSISSTYGNGTAKWYKDENLTQEFTLGTSTVTSDMDLYAKWGVSGNFYIVGDLHMYDNNGNWDNNKGWLLNYPSGSSTCAVSYIAPTGVNRFEILKDKDWNQKIKINNSYAGVLNNTLSDVTLSEVDGHMQFTISESTPQKVTVHYDGKVWVTHEAYTPKYTGWRMTADGWDGQTAWSHSTLLDNTGKAIIRNVSAGQHQFKITDGDDGNVGIEEFNALYVDITNPSQGLTWASATTNYGKTNVPQSDNQYRNCTFTLENNASYMVNGKYDLQVTFDGGKIRCDILPKYTVTFNSNGGSEVASQSVFEGAQASEPSAPTKAGYEFVKWQLSGADYNFSSAVTGNITLDAVWAYKPIESVSLNESTHMTWVGNSDFALTPTLAPSDAIAKSVAWSSDVESVATVSGGTVHAVSAGSAIITCTVTDQFDTQLSASCEVTVAACQMIVENLYSMTVTGYESSTGSSANLNNLWNESSDNEGPATLEKVKIEYKDNNGNNQAPIAVDADHRVKAISGLSDESDYWYRIPTGETIINGSHTYDVYYLKNVKTGEFIYVDKSTEYGHNGDYWHYWATRTSAANAETDIYKWFTAVNYNQGDHRNVIVCKDGFNNTYSGDGARTNIGLYRTDVNPSTEWSDPLIKCGQKVMNGYQNAHTGMVPSVSSENIPNPTYKASLMNGSYYRMKENATVQANLAAPLVSGAVITVRLYADANTTVKLQKTDGTEIETIDLSADTEREYSYTVASNSALLGENAFVIKAADNHAGIASIVVSRTYAASPSDPVLEWETDLSGGVTRSVLSGTFQHIASSTLSSGAIHYISLDETVATVAADGTVTPLAAGNTTITATIEAEGCYDEAYITYNVTLTEASLQEAIDATPGGGTLTLTHDYNDDAVIEKAITINGDGHTIGDLKIENTGDLTLSSGLTVRDFTICAKAGNTSIQAASGQVRNAANLTCSRNAYFLYTVDPSGQVHYGWYDFTVPFPVNAASGIKGIQEGVLKENFAYGPDYAIMDYNGAKQAQGQYPYKKFSGIMQPNKLYSITLDDDYNYNTVRFQKTADGALVTGNDVTLNAYPGDGIHDNWNGVGNGTLHHADAGNLSSGYVQVYQSGDKTFLPVNISNYSFVVGTAFMVQETGTMTLSQATPGHDLLAPARQESAPATAIQIAREGQPFSDQLFISASETGGQAYTPGTDLAKAGDLGSANVPQIWTNAYNSPLCVHEAQLINGEATYNLSLYAPAADTYTLTSQNIPADYSLYLTQNGTMLTELSGTYTLNLSKGITTEYGLLLVETYKTPTGIEEPMSQESRVKSQKILRGGVLYILHNGKVYNAQGGKVCDL